MKNRHDGCPSDVELQRVVDRQADPDVIDRVEDHISHCSYCIERLAQTGFSDSKLLRIQSPSQASPDSGDLPVNVRDALVRSISATPFSWPTVIGPYRVIRKIGQGAMGEVFECHDDRLDRRVAVKTIIQRLITDETLKRISEEARLQAGLQHPNIVRLYDLGMTADGTPFLVMELVSGTTLKERVKAAKLSPKAAAELVRTCALAIHYAHEHGVVHRDLKPSNILLASEPEAATDSTSEMRFEPKIADFGLAKSIEDESHVLLSGSLVGTPAYMAPEQIHAGLRIGPGTDIYALGAILYECLTGHTPFPADSLAGMVRKIEESEPIEPSVLNEAIPIDLQTICLKCLEKQPENRYINASALAQDLQRFLYGHPVCARRVPRIVRVGRWCQRQPLLASSLALTAVLSGILVVGSVSVAISQSRLRLEAQQAAQHAAESEQRAETQRDFALDVLSDSTTSIFNAFMNLRTLRNEIRDDPGIRNAKSMLAGNFARIAERTMSVPAIERLRPDEMIELRFRAAMLQSSAGFPEFAMPILEDLKRFTAELPPDLERTDKVVSALLSAANLEASILKNHYKRPQDAEKLWAEAWEKWTNPESRIEISGPKALPILMTLGANYAKHLESSGKMPEAREVRQVIAKRKANRIVRSDGSISKPPFASEMPKPVRP